MPTLLLVEGPPMEKRTQPHGSQNATMGNVQVEAQLIRASGERTHLSLNTCLAKRLHGGQRLVHNSAIVSIHILAKPLGLALLRLGMLGELLQ